MAFIASSGGLFSLFGLRPTGPATQRFPSPAPAGERPSFSPGGQARRCRAKPNGSTPVGVARAAPTFGARTYPAQRWRTTLPKANRSKGAPPGPTPTPATSRSSGSAISLATSRTVRLQRQTRTVRSSEEWLRIWTRRRATFGLWAVGWAILAVLFSFTHGGWLVILMCLAAATLSTADAVKAFVLVSRTIGRVEGEAADQPSRLEADRSRRGRSQRGHPD